MIMFYSILSEVSNSCGKPWKPFFEIAHGERLYPHTGSRVQVDQGLIRFKHQVLWNQPTVFEPLSRLRLRVDLP